MNIYARIKKDHERHRDLAKTLAETSGDSETRRRLWDEFKADVEAHAHAEEQTFYAAIMGIPKTQEEARHSVAEHKELDDLFEEISEIEMSSSAWLKRYRELHDRLLHHMEEEETEIFPAARAVLDSLQAEEMTRDFDAMKKQEK